MEKNFERLLTVAVIGIIICLIFIGIREFSAAPYTVYATANDGGYIPITYYPCTVREVDIETVVVEHDGELWSCWVSETELKPGDIVWAGFASYEGNIEFVNIK